MQRQTPLILVSPLSRRRDIKFRHSSCGRQLVRSRNLSGVLAIAADKRYLPNVKDPEPSDTKLHDDLMTEYFKIVDIVSGFDARLLTIKSWGVTLSLAALGLGFQQDHYGMFLVAALSGLAFWALEVVTKLHQVRYYPRMGDIEAAASELYGIEAPDGPVSSPLIDWSWHTAQSRVSGGTQKADSRRPKRWDEVADKPLRPLLWPHVMIPHVIAFAAGLILFVLGLFGVFGHI